MIGNGRQGPPHDPNRDGCGPAALTLLGWLGAGVLALGRVRGWWA